MSLTLDGTTGISATGNIYGNNVIVTGTLSAGSFSPATFSITGNVTGGNILTGGAMSSTGNAIHGNILTGGVLSATANIIGGNILTGGLISATGNVLTTANISANYLLGNAYFVTGLSPTQIYSGTSNVTVTGSGANISVGVGGTANVAIFATTGEYVTGVVSATGNITAPYFIGNGAALTGLSASKIYNGTSEANIGTSGGNANISIGGTSNVFVVATTGIYTTGLSSVTGNIIGGNITTAGQLVSSVTTGTAPLSVASTTIVPNLYVARANVSDYDVVTTATTGTYYPALFNAVTGNVQNYANSALNFNAATGSLQTTLLVVSGNIQTTTANATSNIGNVSNYFNTIHGKSTTAQYADLAEFYVSDAEYGPGTVLDFGGVNEVTLSSIAGSARVAGVVSTNPAHLMNGMMQSNTKVAVALQGRVPTLVVGTVVKGDMMVSAGNGHAQACAAPAMGTVIGKALENFNGASGTIEIVVGRL